MQEMQEMQERPCGRQTTLRFIRRPQGRHQSANQPFYGGASETAGRAIKGEADEVDLLAAVTIGLGVTLLFDLGEGLLGGAIDLEFEDEDAVGRLGDQIRAAVRLPVFCGDVEEAARGQQDKGR